MKGRHKGRYSFKAWLYKLDGTPPWIICADKPDFPKHRWRNWKTYCRTGKAWSSRYCASNRIVRYIRLYKNFTGSIGRSCICYISRICAVQMQLSYSEKASSKSKTRPTGQKSVTIHFFVRNKYHILYLQELFVNRSGNSTDEYIERRRCQTTRWFSRFTAHYLRKFAPAAI